MVICLIEIELAKVLRFTYFFNQSISIVYQLFTTNFSSLKFKGFEFAKVLRFRKKGFKVK